MVPIEEQLTALVSETMSTEHVELARRIYEFSSEVPRSTVAALLGVPGSEVHTSLALFDEGWSIGSRVRGGVEGEQWEVPRPFVTMASAVRNAG